MTFKDRDAGVGDATKLSDRDVRPDSATQVLKDARVSKSSLIAGRFRTLERLRKARRRLVEAAVRAKHATQVGQDRQSRRIGRLEEPRGSPKQVHRRSDVGPREGAVPGINQLPCSPTGNLPAPFVDRRKLQAVAECLLEVIADQLIDLAPTIAGGQVEPVREQLMELGTL